MMVGLARFKFLRTLCVFMVLNLRDTIKGRMVVQLLEDHLPHVGVSALKERQALVANLGCAVHDVGRIGDCLASSKGEYEAKPKRKALSARHSLPTRYRGAKQRQLLQD